MPFTNLKKVHLFQVLVKYRQVPCNETTITEHAIFSTRSRPHKASVTLRKTIWLVYITAVENTHLKAASVQKPLTGKLERTHHTDRGVLLG